MYIYRLFLNLDVIRAPKIRQINRCLNKWLDEDMLMPISYNTRAFNNMWWPPLYWVMKIIVEISKHLNTAFILFIKFNHSLMQCCGISVVLCHYIYCSTWGVHILTSAKCVAVIFRGLACSFIAEIRRVVMKIYCWASWLAGHIRVH